MSLDRSRRGSALLIVLGMLSFIIVSAIGFSVFMRSTRLPSSYLRRSSAARLIVKAAIARGIDFVDKCVGDNPHPGVGSGETSFAGKTYRNTWKNRVLFGCTESKMSDLVATGWNATNSVTPLCLEALAYLPPSLINDVRYFSNITPTARWKTFELDAGRYNFIAVDVSDFIDINRVAADVRRSSAPNGRISLAYAFEPPRHNNAGSAATQWDEFMEKYRKFDPDSLEYDFSGAYPLISMADWNLAVGDSKFGYISSPFCNFIGSGGNKFYQDSSEADWNGYAMMNFVTDSYFPESAAAKNGESTTAEDGTEKALDLNDPENQPFKWSDLDNKGKKTGDLWRFLAGTGKCQSQDWLDCLSYAGSVALFDYLDTDRVPTFLSLPTAERAPMIAGVRVNFPGTSFAFGDKTTSDPADPAQTEATSMSSPAREVEGVVYYRIDGGKLAAGFGGDVTVLSEFPFAHNNDDDANETYKMDGRFALFFSGEKMGLRTGNATDMLHVDWKNLPSSATAPEKDKGFLMSVPFQETAIGRFEAGVTTGRQTKFDLNQARPTFVSFWNADNADQNAFLVVRYKWRQAPKFAHVVETSTSFQPTFEQVLKNPDHEAVIEITGEMKLFKADGSVETRTYGKSELYGSGIDIYANIAVWARIKDGDGNIVDMAPACIGDDAVAHGMPEAQAFGFAQNYGALWPLLRIDCCGGNPINIKLSTTDWKTPVISNGDFGNAAKTAIVSDPRFNYAPENWFTAGSEALDENFWFAHNGAPGKGEDVWMETSDAGYLQSVYELAMLPALSPLISGGDLKWGKTTATGDLEMPAASKERSLASSREDAMQRRFMWSEYDPCGDHYETFTNLNATFWTGGGSGFRINPFASTNILAAAFANTPVGWRFASTNETANPALAGATAVDFNKKYAFNEYAPDGAKFAWKDVMDLARRFHDKVRENPSNWETAVWRDMGWDGDDTGRIGGQELDSSSDGFCRADRKFLYGYWRDCFATGQQLFLVFARAEPIMAISGDIEKSPPQQGAKAVALVWRDPKPMKGASGDAPPHRTRILFYRQFE